VLPTPWLPLLLLLQVGLLGPDGQDLPLHLEGQGAVGSSTVLRCDAERNSFTFTDVQVRGRCKIRLWYMCCLLGSVM
jgi:hypothetical protein